MRWEAWPTREPHPSHCRNRGPDIAFRQYQVFGHRRNIPDAGVTGGVFAIGAGGPFIEIVGPVSNKGNHDVGLQVWHRTIGKFNRQVEG